MKPIRKLLVIRLSALGDICMTLPVIDSACRAFPDVTFTLLTSKVGALIARTVITCDNLQVMGINKRDYNGVSGLNRLYAELRGCKFDAVADLHDVIRTKWVDIRYRLNGKPVKTLHKGRSEKKALVQHRISRQLATGFERYRDVFAALGMDFTVDFDAQACGARLRQMQDADEAEPLSVGIAPFAQHAGKVYPAPLMRQAIDLLIAKRPDIRIYLFGSSDEAAELDQWAAAHPGVITCLAGRQSITDDLLLMSRLRLMVSMDSANMHLASLVGLRCISVWGATHRYAGFLGYGQHEDNCIELSLPCRPCSVYGNVPCRFGDLHCLNDIRPESVADMICDRL